MKTLIVNNYLGRKKVFRVVEAVEKFSEYEVLSYAQTKELGRAAGNFDAIILTGSEARITRSEHVKLFSAVSELIKDSSTPTFGICFGHQLACLTFGAEVGSLKSPVKRFEKIRVLKENEIFRGFGKGGFAWLAEYHHDYVKKRSLRRAGLELLADSSSCEVEAVKHERKPFYGVQFHPEKAEIGGEKHFDGLKILKNFFNLCGSRRDIG
ncbi:TPA: hypothetical protein EYP26_02160 [Candidatus Bathyarchaeota archaeon]|nr:hypothetical protein [Candidatus Bathyarchaeota archaeon]